jgi:hypothetical protein
MRSIHISRCDINRFSSLTIPYPPSAIRFFPSRAPLLAHHRAHRTHLAEKWFAQLLRQQAGLSRRPRQKRDGVGTSFKYLSAAGTKCEQPHDLRMRFDKNRAP